MRERLGMGGIETVAAAVGADLAARLPGQNKKQREGLALLIATALDVRDVNLMELAAARPRAAERLDMRYQWISRLLGNPPPGPAPPSGWTCATSGSAGCSATRRPAPRRRAAGHARPVDQPAARQPAARPRAAERLDMRDQWISRLLGNPPPGPAPPSGWTCATSGSAGCSATRRPAPRRRAAGHARPVDQPAARQPAHRHRRRDG